MKNKTITLTVKLPMKVYASLLEVVSEGELLSIMREESLTAAWDIFHALRGYFKNMKKAKKVTDKG